MIMDIKETLKNTLNELYGSEGAKAILARLSFESIGKAPRKVLWDESSMALITYGDSIGTTGQVPLVSLTSFLQRELEGTLPWVHLLPFFPFTSDDGFSVSDYRKVRPDLGSWREIESMKDSFSLFFDAVINHTSISHSWFVGWKKGDPAYEHFYLSYPKEIDVSAVTRPRTHPLLTPFETSKGEKWVWTTFSEDQADLDFSSSEVFVALAELLRFYAEKGATGIRLDAIGHGWKDPERSSLNLPEAHRWIVAMRSYLELVGADVILLSETNVPQAENLLYFGDREPEAHLIYNFALSGLVAHGFLTESAKALGDYLQTLSVPREDTGYFHVLATHDGIGVRPLIGILSKEEIEQLAEATIARGGAVNFKINADDSRSPYELNITYYSILKAPQESEEWTARKFRSAHMILLSLAGIPGIYYHSLFASENQLDEKERTGMNRSINRKAIALPLTKREERWMGEMKELFYARSQNAAFHPNGKQEIFCSDSLFQIKRTALDGSGSVSCLINMTHVEIELEARAVGLDLITGDRVDRLQPFEGRWISRREK